MSDRSPSSTGGAPTHPLENRSHAELAMLVPEYLLAGGVIDRAGMPHVIGSLGPDAMAQVAIEEWMGASPVYTRRLQRALDFEGDSVETIFKSMQLDVGAVPQYMDFRYLVHDHDHGEFWLDHCGALMDVEPMGDDFVVAMCHTIEDPTFDATAAATNPRAQVRPLHRPPRTPADRHPHCHWQVTIADDHPPLGLPAEAEAMAATRVATIDLAPIDPGEQGRTDYTGPLLDDLRFEDWSAGALVRIAQEVCLEGHLLVLAFRAALGRRMSDVDAADIVRKQFAGVAGLAAERLRHALGLGTTLDDAATVLALHPALQPAPYVGATVELGDRLVLRMDRRAPAVLDGAWPALLDPEHLAPLDAVVWAVDPQMHCLALDDESTDDTLVVEVVMGDEPAAAFPDVELVRLSGGAEFRFADRGTPVELRAGVSPRAHR
jgi:hypothetical protein